MTIASRRTDDGGRPASDGHRRRRQPLSGARIRRSRYRLVAGVAAGIAEFVGANVAVVRWIWLASLPLSGGLTAVAYLALWGLLPSPPEKR